MEQQLIIQPHQRTIGINMTKTHHYQVQINWTGNQGTGTSGYTAYSRDHELHIPGKESIACSSDIAFRGDPAKHNPEELFLYALSSCHMLWYLHFCADAGIIVTDYTDKPTGTMVEEPGNGRFTEVVLHPQIKITDASKIDLARELHQQAHANCFIANSCNFPVRVEAEII